MKYTRFIFFFLWIASLMNVYKAYGQASEVSATDTYQDEPLRWMKYSDQSKALYNQIASFAEKSLNERQSKVSKINEKEEWINYIGTLKNTFSESLKGFKKSPLNVKVTGIIERENYRIEKIVFESLPGFYVTGCLFIPNTPRQKKMPAVIVPTGHSQSAFRRDIYQTTTLNLVKKGFIVFTYDPVGQGERVQYLDNASDKSYIGGSTFEHSYAGVQSLLAGKSISDYFIWDGVRAIDFLFSRPEVDSSRIGMTGVSGGGTQTAFVSAFDSRIHAAAPECYITSYQRLFESVGPQDAEQNLYNGLLNGIDHVELLAMRAPKPTLIISTTQDFFSIQGTRETYNESKDIFKTLGYPGNISMIEADGTHGSNKENRERMYQFFQKELNYPGNSIDLKVSYFNEKELNVTPTGQVSTSYNSKTIFDFNKENSLTLIKNRVVKNYKDLQENKFEILSRAYELSGYDTTRQIKSVVFTGKIELEKYVIEKYFIQGLNFNYAIPFVFIKPYTADKTPLIIYVDSKGKDRLLNNEHEIMDYIEKGYAVIAPDLIGIGELENKGFKGDSYVQDYSFNLIFAANLVGKSIAGMQASDLYLVFSHLLSLDNIDKENIISVVKDEVCSSYLHFAIFNDKIKKTILVNPLISFENLATTRNYNPNYIWTAVPGAIQHYDLNYLQALLAPGKLTIINPVSAQGEYTEGTDESGSTGLITETYKMHGSLMNLNIIAGKRISDEDVLKYVD